MNHEVKMPNTTIKEAGFKKKRAPLYHNRTEIEFTPKIGVSCRVDHHIVKNCIIVFESIEDYKARINDLDVDESAVLVLKNCGPRGYPGMAEVGNMGLPPKLLKKGVRDMVRISDARMSGTAYGTVVLHVAPEAAAGGPLALVQEGDMIELDVENRKLHLDVSDEELARRREAWVAPEPRMTGGYQKLYFDHVMQADKGVDLDFLVGPRGAEIPRESH